MSDFRVPISSSTLSNEPSTARELDWDNKSKKWTLSEKDAYEVSWLQGLNPTYEDLLTLREFFRIPETAINVNKLLNVSPGELCLIHQNLVSPPSIYANICTNCGLHWLVYRWDEEKCEWLIFGRDCDFVWKRGKILDEEEVNTLLKIRGNTSPPTK